MTVEHGLTDNGSCYKPRLFTQALTAAGLTHKRTRPYRTQMNGKVERFNRTLAEEWAHLRPYTRNASPQRCTRITEPDIHSLSRIGTVDQSSSTASAARTSSPHGPRRSAGSVIVTRTHVRSERAGLTGR